MPRTDRNPGCSANNENQDQVSVLISANTNNNGDIKDSTVDDSYAEAWLELGAPISIPFLRFLWSIFQWAVDNFFLVKNTYNAIHAVTEEQEDSTGSIEVSINLLIAGATILFHVICCVLISVADSYNTEALSGKKNSRFPVFRFLAHLTLTMKLFRYFTAYLENRRINQELILIQMRRQPITRREIDFVVAIKKNDYIECHYDLIEAFFKTIPAALLQVFFMFQSTPDARLKLTTTTDQDRFATVFYTIISAAITATNYQFSYLTYKKVLHFQECFRTNFLSQMNLNLPGNFSFAVTLVTFMATIGIRMCFYSFVLFGRPVLFVITIGLILLVNWLIIFNWKRSSWRFRAVLENPLHGTPWVVFDMIDLWINLFIPGVHYPKPLDYFLNFYCTTMVGLLVFKGGTFIIPNAFNGRENGTDTFSVFRKEQPISQSVIDEIIYAKLEQSANNCTLQNTYEEMKPPTSIDETLFFISTLIQYLILAHEYVTLHQMSYADFFYKAISYMNVINLFCLLYTILMNAFKFQDLDFPAQIANDFFMKVIGDHTEKTNDWNNVDKIKRFLLFSILPNSVFFHQFNSKINCNKVTWKSISEKQFIELLSWMKSSKTIRTSNRCFNKCLPIVCIYNLLSPVLYPERVRIAKIDWNVDDSLEAIKSSVEHQVLKEQLCCFADDVYLLLKIREATIEDCKQEVDTIKQLLAVFYKNYDEITRNTTSLRIQLTFAFLMKPVAKGISETSGTQINYDQTYFSRISDAIMKHRRGKTRRVNQLL